MDDDSTAGLAHMCSQSTLMQSALLHSFTDPWHQAMLTSLASAMPAGCCCVVLGMAGCDVRQALVITTVCRVASGSTAEIVLVWIGVCCLLCGFAMPTSRRVARQRMVVRGWFGTSAFADK